MRYDELTEHIAAVGRVATASVDEQLKAVKVALTGAEDGIGGVASETSEGEVLYGALGLVSRPRDAVLSTTATAHNPEGYAEFIGLRFGDQVQPIATFDARLSAKFPAIKSGEIALVGYAGGFASLADTSDLTGTRITLYAPHLDGSGAVDKAYVLTLDPEGEIVSLAHADGMALTMFQEAVTLKNADGSSWVNLDASYVRTSAQNVFTQTGSFIVYVPNSTNTAAHVLAMEDNGGYVALGNRSGAALVMENNQGPVLKSKDGTAFIQVGDSNGQNYISGNTSIDGGVNLGSASPADAVMLATQLLVWVGQVNAALVAINTATSAGATMPTAVPVPATRVKAT